MKGKRQTADHKIVTLLVSAIITGVFAYLLYYLGVPALNVRSRELWEYLVLVILAFVGVYMLAYRIAERKNIGWDTDDELYKWVRNGCLIVAGGIVVLLVTFTFFSSGMFHAKAYAKLLTVEEDCNFDADLGETLSTDVIALMDTDSARMLGDREIGSLTELVSQYDVSGTYSQINYQDTPVKVAPLVYESFFKYNRNKERGVPGYVVVSPADMSAEYVELEENMKYVPSAYWSDDLLRHIRSEYRSEMIEGMWFEIDENGKPYYVASVYEYTIGIFGGKDIVGVIIIDPVSGEMEYCTVAEVPSWVDIVYDGDMLCEQYDCYGKLRNGFFNSVLSANGCKVTTDDYGYVAIANDIWVYTGVTSVNSDASNIGFVLMNERTKEARSYTIAGADEESAMSAAEGEVQQYGYEASFPSLINVDGDATYIMVLKDSGGLVKMYAAVNVEQYNMVAVANKQKDCIDKYRQMMSGDVFPEEEQLTTENAGNASEEPQNLTGQAEPEETIDEALYVQKQVTIVKMETIDIDGNTYLYLVTQEGEIFHAKYADVIEMLLAEEGDTVTIRTYEDKFIYP